MTCRTPGCELPVRSRGLCNTCYYNIIRGMDPTFDGRRIPNYIRFSLAPKDCATCGETKPTNKFHYSHNGLTDMCRLCYREAMLALVPKRSKKGFTKPKKPCAFGPCGRDAVSNGLCSGHNMQAWKGKELTPLEIKRHQDPDAQRECLACHLVKPLSQYYKHSNGHGWQGHCKACMTACGRVRQYINNGNPEAALEVAESLPESIRQKYVDQAMAAINGDVEANA